MFRKSTEEVLENHIRDLKSQLKQRDDLIDRLRENVSRLEEDKTSLEEMVRLYFQCRVFKISPQR